MSDFIFLSNPLFFFPHSQYPKIDEHKRNHWEPFLYNFLFSNSRDPRNCYHNSYFYYHYSIIIIILRNLLPTIKKNPRNDTLYPKTRLNNYIYCPPEQLIPTSEYHTPETLPHWPRLKTWRKSLTIFQPPTHLASTASENQKKSHNAHPAKYPHQPPPQITTPRKQTNLERRKRRKKKKRKRRKNANRHRNSHRPLRKNNPSPNSQINLEFPYSKSSFPPPLPPLPPPPPPLTKNFGLFIYLFTEIQRFHPPPRPRRRRSLRRRRLR